MINHQSEVSTKEFSLKQKKTLGLIKKPALSAERTNSGQVGGAKGLLLYEALKDPCRKNETKIVGDFLTGTYTDFQKIKTPNSQQQGVKGFRKGPGMSQTQKNFYDLGKNIQSNRKKILSTFDRYTGLLDTKYAAAGADILMTNVNASKAQSQLAHRAEPFENTEDKAQSTVKVLGVT